MNDTPIQAGFVGRAIDGLRAVFDADGPEEDAASYVPTLVRRLFGDALGYDDTAYSQQDDWTTVRFVDESGRPAIVLTATGVGKDIRTARRRAFRAASEAPSVRYLVATNRNRLVSFACCSADHADAEISNGTAARPLADVDLRDAVERSDGRSLAEALTPGQQLSLAKLTGLQRGAVGDPPERDSPEELTLEELSGAGSTPSAGTPDALAATLTETLADVLAPAVEDAFDRLIQRMQAFAERETALEDRIDEAKAAGNDATVSRIRTDLFDLREEYATARRLEAGFARWLRVSPDDEGRETFCAESAAVALDTLLLARVAGDRGLAGDFDAYREFWEDHADHAERDAGDLVRAVRQELAGVSADATDDGTFSWVFEADIADAFDDAVQELSAADVDRLDATALTDAFDSHLAADARPVRGATRPATAGLLLDRAEYTADALIDDPEADVLDPACGDGSVLVGAADRLLDRLDRTDASPTETLGTVRNRLHGLDSHPYAVHLAETRLLLRTLDVYADAVAADAEFALERFSIHRTDALRDGPVEDGAEADGAEVDGAVEGGAEVDRGDSKGADIDRAGESRRAQRRAAAAAVKEHSTFGYVVCDAPTTPRSALPDGPATAAYDTYENAAGEYDLSALFLERSANWLAPGGRLSMSVAGDLLDDPAAGGARDRLAAAFRIRELVDFDTGGESTPLFVAAQRREDGSSAADEFTYARVTPTFIELVREGLVRPDGSGSARPAELVARCLPDDAGGDPPAMETVLVELDLVCDATVDGAMPVEVETAGSDALEGEWSFAARATREAGSSRDGRADDDGTGGAHSWTGSPGDV